MKTKAIFICIVVFIIGCILIVLLRKDGGKNNVRDRDTGFVSSYLTVSPQTVKDGVNVDSVTMPINGYVVARAIEGNRLSQVIEISKFLEKGEYKDIQISLGEFYNGEELIVMIYADNGDKIFNDNDQPFKDAGGNMIARYVKTGDVVPMSMMQPDPNAMAGHMMGSAMIVKYTNTGFEPKTLTVPLGSMVQFINESDKEMWVASNEHPSHEMLPTFDQFGTAPKGGSYTYLFDKAGTWPYHDHINAAKEGVIIVQ